MAHRQARRIACDYAFIAAGEAIYFFTVYGKTQQSDLLPEEKKVFREVLDRLTRMYRD